MCKSFIYIKHGSVFFIVTLVYTCRAFLLHHQKIFVPYIVLYTVCLSLLHNETVFSPSKYIGYKCYICFIPGMGHFFSPSHLSRFFCSIIRKYLSHVLFWSQLVSFCFAMKFFCFFKIHCLQMFQTRDGPFFFIITLVYTCRAFFALSSENICPMYCFGHSSSQSVSQWNSFSPLKYIVYKCFSCFRPGMGHFFHRHTCRAFFALSSENICPIYCFGHSSSQSVSQWNSFFPLKYIVYKCFSCFRPRMGHFFFIVTLVYTCRAFFAVSSENICPIYCFGHSSSQSVSQWNSFFSLKYIVYKCFSCFRPRMDQFFSSSHLSTLVALFCSIIRKYLSHVLFWSRLVSVCFTMRFFFSFKIHCLQVFQLFQTRDGPFFFIVTLVYTCHFFFAVSSKNINHIYCFAHSSSQSVSQWNSFLL